MSAAGGTYDVYEDREIVGSSDLDKANAAIKSNTQAVANWRNQMREVTKEANELTFAVRGSSTAPTTTTTKGGGSSSSAAKEKTRLQELNDLVNKAKDDYVSAGEEERTTIAQNIAAWNSEIDVIKRLQAEAERPAKLSSFDDIDKEISYQQMLRRGANDEQLAGIDKEIERLTALRKQRELAAHTPVATDQIETYEQLNTELEYYTQKLSTATATERTEIQKQINALNDLKSAWDDVLAELKKPGDISTLNTIADLDDAISYYQQLQKKQSADEVQNTQKTIDALNAKRDALQRGIELPSMQKEIDEVNALTGHDYKVKIKGMGFDELTEKINALNRMLADTENPVTDDQRKDIERMISTYEQWRKTSVRTFDTFKTGYSGIKGMGDGVQSITDALEGNGNAWQKVTGIIDGFLQLYEGIQTVVAIINMLTAASAAHAATKGVEAGAETTEAGVREAATTANVGASAVQIAANKLETASWTELAAAEYMAAHAYIPFAGFGIAAGFTAAMEAMVIAAGIPMYADGGIAYGPTLGIFGEYAGAANNPEVVAPLDKLRNMLEPAGGIASGKVEFEIDGRVLRGVLKKVENLSNRS
jgi:hypothetical protein